jgi:hypothetical protein
MDQFHPLFYVQLKDDFNETCEIREKTPLFPGMQDPYLEARKHVSSGKVYPVIQVKGDRDLLILDDKGFLYETPRDLYKFAESPS